jgi:hypothetical protein
MAVPVSFRARYEHMSGTYINQQDFTDINACMDYMSKADTAAWEFTQILGVYPRHPALSPITELREAARQSKSWDLKSNVDYYLNFAELLAELIRFTDYVVGLTSEPTAADIRRGAIVLEQAATPSGPEPSYATGALTNCLQVLRHYQHMLSCKSELGRIAAPGYEDLRRGIYTTLPRLAHFMSFYLRAPAPTTRNRAGLSKAGELAKDLDRVYALGMIGMANFLAQIQRLTGLVSEASHRLTKLESAGSMRKVATQLKRVKRDLVEAQRYCEDIAALGCRS